jgi:phosphatidylglycerol:prolipoprotein diacylglycerol transferase
VGVILVMFFYARAKTLPFYNVADATALFTPLCLGLGRCANFLNGELWGRPTDAWWGVIFPGAPRVALPDMPGLWMNVPRYPSPLVEALLEGLLLQLVLLSVRFSTRREGAVALTFMGAYAVLRIVGEQFRQPDEDMGFWFGTITQGQLLSGIMLLATAILAWLQFFSRPVEGQPPA